MKKTAKEKNWEYFNSLYKELSYEYQKAIYNYLRTLDYKEKACKAKIIYDYIESKISSDSRTYEEILDSASKELVGSATCTETIKKALARRTDTKGDTYIAICKALDISAKDIENITANNDISNVTLDIKIYYYLLTAREQNAFNILIFQLFLPYDALTILENSDIDYDDMGSTPNIKKPTPKKLRISE